MSDVERGYVYAGLLANDRDGNLERANSLNVSTPSQTHDHNTPARKAPQHDDTLFETFLNREQAFWDRLRGKGRRVPGGLESAKNVLLSSCESRHSHYTLYILIYMQPSICYSSSYLSHGRHIL